MVLVIEGIKNAVREYFKNNVPAGIDLTKDNFVTIMLSPPVKKEEKWVDEFKFYPGTMHGHEAICTFFILI